MSRQRVKGRRGCGRIYYPVREYFYVSYQFYSVRMNDPTQLRSVHIIRNILIRAMNYVRDFVPVTARFWPGGTCNSYAYSKYFLYSVIVAGQKVTPIIIWRVYNKFVPYELNLNRGPRPRNIRSVQNIYAAVQYISSLASGLDH